MRRIGYILFAVGLSMIAAGCNSAKAPNSASEQPAPARPAETSAPRIYVTNEVGGDLSIIDSGNYNVLATVPLGKRPRGFMPALITRQFMSPSAARRLPGPMSMKALFPRPTRRPTG